MCLCIIITYIHRMKDCEEGALNMESIINIDIPIQMISCTDRDGKITPIRFRFQDKNDEIVTINIESVISRKLDTNKACTKYTCSAHVHGIQKTFVLNYNFCLHQWKLIKAYS